MTVFGKILAVATLVSAFAGFTSSVYAGLGSCPLGIVAEQPFGNGLVVKPHVHGGLGSSPVGFIRDRSPSTVVAPPLQTVEDEFKVEKGELCPEFIELMYGLGIWP